MGAVAAPVEDKGGALYWDYDLDEESRATKADGSISPRNSSRVAKTLTYRADMLPLARIRIHRSAFATLYHSLSH